LATQKVKGIYQVYLFNYCWHRK